MMIAAFAQPAKAYDIWKHYTEINLGYSSQSISGNDNTWHSDYGANFEIGRTFFLHRKPISNHLKVGFDLLFSADYAKFTETGNMKYDVVPPNYIDMDDYLESVKKVGIHEANIGIALGPSFTIALSKNIRGKVFFHFTPSWSFFVVDGQINNSFVPYLNGGLQIGWRALSVGYEYRKGSGKYKLLDIDAILSGETIPPSEKVKYKTTQSRVYISFHF